MEMIASLATFWPRSSGEGNYLDSVKCFCTKNGSSQGRDLALTGLFVPGSLDSGDSIM